jgi:hypothetical protein
VEQWLALHWALGISANAPATSLRRLLVVTVTLDVPDETFFFAHLLESAKHLLDRLVTSSPDFNHTVITVPFFIRIPEEAGLYPRDLVFARKNIAGRTFCDLAIAMIISVCS